MSDDKVTVEVGRLAMRSEGDFWVAYLARPDTMDNALKLGSIRLGLVANKARRMAFLAALQELLSGEIAELFRQQPSWDGPRRPPEHERKKTP